MDKYIGRLLDGRYEILEVIGVGGMAVVYKAMCHRLNRLVAVKILKDEYSRDEEFRRRFHGESQAVAMMSHPNIVNVYDVSKSEGVDYIVMELIDGITLKQYMEKKGALSWRETLHFSMQIAKALDHAHSRGIIHRDIKPHNVMILKDGSVKVADFGIARVATAQNTLTKEALGSVHYISPEQARGGRVDCRTDIYSLGVVMYQMLTGRPPFDGDTPVSVAIQHINGKAPLPSTIAANIPLGLEQITMHAMCNDLSRRYASAEEMLRDMEEFRKTPSIQFDFSLEQEAGRPAAAPVRPQQTARPPVRRESAPDLQEEEDERDTSRKRTITITVAVCVLLAVVGIGFLIFALAGGGKTEDNTMPNLVGYIWDELDASKYENLELIVDDDSYEYNDDYPEGVICHQSVEEGTVLPEGEKTEVRLSISLGKQTDTMPDLVGKTAEYAQAYMKAMTVQITCLTEEDFDDEIKEGRVIRTDPAAGETLTEGQIVTIYVSKGPEEAMTTVPQVEGDSLETAKAKLTAKNLDYAVKEVYNADVKAGLVISQDVDAGTEVPEGTVINLVVSKGSQTVKVPSVTGKSESAASAAITNLGLKVSIKREYSSSVAAGLVISQSYDSGTELAPGTTVTLTVSDGPAPTEPTDPPASTDTEDSGNTPTPEE